MKRGFWLIVFLSGLLVACAELTVTPSPSLTATPLATTSPLSPIDLDLAAHRTPSLTITVTPSPSPTLTPITVPASPYPAQEVSKARLGDRGALAFTIDGNLIVEEGDQRYQLTRDGRTMDFAWALYGRIIYYRQSSPLGCYEHWISDPRGARPINLTAEIPNLPPCSRFVEWAPDESYRMLLQAGLQFAFWVVDPVARTAYRLPNPVPNAIRPSPWATWLSSEEVWVSAFGSAGVLSHHIVNLETGETSTRRDIATREVALSPQKELLLSIDTSRRSVSLIQLRSGEIKPIWGIPSKTLAEAPFSYIEEVRWTSDRYATIRERLVGEASPGPKSAVTILDTQRPTRTLTIPEALDAIESCESQFMDVSTQDGKLLRVTLAVLSSAGAENIQWVDLDTLEVKLLAQHNGHIVEPPTVTYTNNYVYTITDGTDAGIWQMDLWGSHRIVAAEPNVVCDGLLGPPKVDQSAYYLLFRCARQSEGRLTDQQLFTFSWFPKGLTRVAPFPLPLPAVVSPVPPPPLRRGLVADGQAILEFLNASPANRARLSKLLVFWRDLGEGSLPPSILAEADLNADGSSEIVAVDYWCEPPMMTCIYIFRGSRGGSGGYSVDYQAESFSIAIQCIADINNDGRVELVYTEDNPSASNVTPIVNILSWDGHTYRSLTDPQEPVTLVNGRLAIEDENGDGVDEIILAHGGYYNSAAMGIQRTHTYIYRWDGHYYRLAEDRIDPDPHLVLVVIDATEALEKGDLGAAEALYHRALTDETLEELYEGERDDLTPFVYFRLALVAALRGDDTGVEAEVEEARLFAPDALYTEAAQTFARIYAEGGDISAVCKDVNAYIEENSDREPKFDEKGWGSPFIREGFCPIPTPTPTPSPTPTPLSTVPL